MKMCEVNILEIRVMLTGVSGTMVKEIKKKKILYKKQYFLLFLEVDYTNFKKILLYLIP
jgi:hypothetical protein